MCAQLSYTFCIKIIFPLHYHYPFFPIHVYRCVKLKFKYHLSNYYLKFSPFDIMKNTLLGVYKSQNQSILGVVAAKRIV